MVNENNVPVSTNVVWHQTTVTKELIIEIKGAQISILPFNPI